jgi:5-methylcytosine-specific restriction endonuclease McrA
MVLTRKVLLLNASYEPLNVVTAPRALALIWRHVAEVVEPDEGRVLRTPRFAFALPSVVRLTQYLEARPRRRGPAGRARVLARDRYRCQYCGRRGTQFDLTLDHIIPKSRGGRSVPENLCAACRGCNTRKGDRTPDEARMPLLANPSALYYGLERAALVQAAESRPEWRKYLFLDDEREETA